MSEEKPPMSKEKQLDNESMRTLVFRKKIIDSIMVAITFAAILLSAYWKFIDNCVTGTLFGTVIGYSLKNLGKSKKS